MGNEEKSLLRIFIVILIMASVVLLQKEPEFSQITVAVLDKKIVEGEFLIKISHNHYQKLIVDQGAFLAVGIGDVLLLNCSGNDCFGLERLSYKNSHKMLDPGKIFEKEFVVDAVGYKYLVDKYIIPDSSRLYPYLSLDSMVTFYFSKNDIVGFDINQKPTLSLTGDYFLK